MMKRFLTALLLGAVLFPSPSAGAGKKERNAWVWPDRTGWNKVSPEKYGYDSLRLEDVRKFIIDKTHVTGLVIIVGGEMIFEYGATDRLSYIASCRKSILSMLLGKYIENGTIRLDASLRELGIDDIGGLLDCEKEATFRHLVTARSGVYHEASNSGTNLRHRPARGSRKPGTCFLYNNWDFNTAFAIFEQLTGKEVYDTFYEDIGSRIGLQDWDRNAQKKSGDLTVSRYPAPHFYLSVRDMARIGYLMLRRGVWNGERILSEKWVRQSTSIVTTPEEAGYGNPDSRYGYGYMWWIYNPRYSGFTPEYEGAFAAHGSMGQYINVFPAADMVVAIKTDSIYGRRTTSAAAHKLQDLIFAAFIPRR